MNFKRPLAFISVAVDDERSNCRFVFSLDLTVASGVTEGIFFVTPAGVEAGRLASVAGGAFGVNNFMMGGGSR